MAVLKFSVNQRTVVVLWFVAICAVTIGSLSPADSSFMFALDCLDVNDKLLHFSAYVVLALLPMLGLRAKGIALGAAGSMALLGLLLELAQNFSPGRTPDIFDELANVLGVACGIALALPLRQRLTSEPTD